MNRTERPGGINSRSRLILFGSVILSVFLVLIIYLFNLQIVENLLWEGRAKAVSSRSEVLPAQRGLIWDRNTDEPLAMNIDSFAVHLIHLPNCSISRNTWCWMPCRRTGRIRGAP